MRVIPDKAILASRRILEVHFPGAAVALAIFAIGVTTAADARYLIELLHPLHAALPAICSILLLLIVAEVPGHDGRTVIWPVAIHDMLLVSPIAPGCWTGWRRYRSDRGSSERLAPLPA